MRSTTTSTDKDRWKLLKTAFAIAKHEKGMPPDQFREAVPHWGFPRLSDCNKADLRAIISRMKRWYTAKQSGNTCSQDQLDYLQLLWEKKSKQKDKKSLDSYLLNKFTVMHARLMSTGQCSDAIQSLKKWR